MEVVGGIHHVTARSPSGRLLYRDSEDRRVYLRLLAGGAERAGWQVLSYCLMSNHIHVLVRTPDPNLGHGIKHAHETFATFVNQKYGEHGHVFGQRFANKLVRDETHLYGCFRYIARNPVAAGLCDAPDEWRWSAHAALMGEEEPHEVLDVAAAFGSLGAPRADARAKYSELTATPDRRLLTELSSKCDSDAWIRGAIDDYGVSIETIALHLAIKPRTAYERLAKARARATAKPGAPH